MDVKLAYGRTGLTVTLPDQRDIVAAPSLPGVANPAIALLQAMRNPIGTPPLAELVKPGDTVVIVHSDITRATPNDRDLCRSCWPNWSGRRATRGHHAAQRPGHASPADRCRTARLLGDAIVDNYRCVQHDASTTTISSRWAHLQRPPVRVNRLLVEADVRILTGFIEPHFFAGFSGGPKAVLPAHRRRGKRAQQPRSRT